MMMSDLKLAQTRHVYSFGGAGLPSVTTITKLLDNDKSMRFAGAAAKLAKEGRDFRAEWKAKGQRGTDLHGHIESWLRGEDAIYPLEYRGYMQAAEKYLVARPQKWLHVEPIIVGDGWGGRSDALTDIAVRDWKSGEPYTEHLIQLGAYANGLGIAQYDHNGNYAGMEPLPQFKCGGCVYLHDDGTFEEREYSRADLDLAYEAFLGLLAAHRWLEGRK